MKPIINKTNSSLSLLPGVFDGFCLFLLLILVFRGQTMAIDPGLGWHLRTGQFILASGSVLESDPFLFTTEGRPWVPTQWLADLFFWQIYSWGGLPLLHAVTIGLCISPLAFVLVPLLRKINAGAMLSILVLLLSALCLSVQWLIRPVLFSFLMFAIVYVILLRFLKEEPVAGSSRCIYLLPFIFFLWANLHPGFVLGLFLVGVYFSFTLFRAISRDKHRSSLSSIIMILAGSILATLVTPNGLSLYSSIFSLASSDYFMNLNLEWLAPTLSKPDFWPFFFSSIVALFFVLAQFTRQGRKSCPLELIVIALVFFIFSCFQRRYIPFWGITLVCPMVLLLQQALSAFHSDALARFSIWSSKASSYDNSRSGFLWTLAGSVCLLGFTTVQGRLPGGEASASDFSASLYPIEAVEMLSELPNQGSGRIFHSPNLGGYLIWTLFPSKGVFIDDRNVLCGEQLYRDYFDALSGVGWEELFEKYDIEWAILPPGAELSKVLELSPYWSIIWSDRQVNVHQRQLIAADNNPTVE